MLGIITVMGIICLPSPFYAQVITGGNKTIDAAIVAIFYLLGTLMVNKLMPQRDIKK